MMAFISHRIVAGLALLTACVGIAQARQPSPPTQPEQLLFWGVKRGTLHDDALEKVVLSRLKQLGEVVSDERDSQGVCQGPACGRALAAKKGLKSGWMVGGDITASTGADVAGRLWWVDLASDKTVSREVQCRGCDPLLVIPREAAQLVLSAPLATGEHEPRSSYPTPLADPQPPEQAEPLRSALAYGVGLSVTARSGAKVVALKLAKVVQKTLLQMGLAVSTRLGGSRSRGEAESPASLDIELSGDSNALLRRGAVETITMRLRAHGAERTVHFACAADSCQDQLDRSLVQNLAPLFDTGTLPNLAAAAVIPDPEPTRPAAPQPSAMALVGTAFHPPLVLAAAPTPIPTSTSPSPGLPPAPDVSLVPPPVEVQPVAEESKPALPTTACPPSKTQKSLRIAGGVLLGVGLAGLVPSGVLLSKHGDPAGTCPIEGGPCKWDTQTGASLGLVVSGVGAITGGVLLLLSTRSNSRERESPCVTQ